jgi:hypothetical protein
MDLCRIVRSRRALYVWKPYSSGSFPDCVEHQWPAVEALGPRFAEGRVDGLLWAKAQHETNCTVDQERK